MKKPTLQIKAFTGVDRRSDGTVTPDNQFFSLSNWHQKSLGELESLKGVVQKNASALPGVGEVIHTAFHKNTGENTKALVFFKPSITGASDFGEASISASNFSIAGTGTDYFFYVTLTGAGGLFKTVYIAAVDGGSATTNLITFTTPLSGIPDWVCQINIYYKAFVGLQPGTFCGSLTRRGGSFPATATMYPPASNSLTGNTALQINPDHGAIFSSDIGGSLIPNKTYYIGVSPNLFPAAGYPFSRPYSRVRLFDASKNILSVTVPNGSTKLTYRIYFATDDLAISGTSVSRVFVFAGQSPEDVLLASRISGDSIGAYASAPISQNRIGLSDFPGGVHVESTDILTYGNGTSYEDETPFVFTGTSVAGLTSGNVYWIKYVNAASVRVATSLDRCRKGIFVDITSTDAWTNQALVQSYVDLELDHMPYNTNNGVNMVKSYLSGSGPIYVSPKQLGGTFQEGDAFRYDGVFINGALYPSINLKTRERSYKSGFDYEEYPISTNAADNIGCWVFDSLTMDPSSGHQLLANISDKNFSATGQKKINDGSGTSFEVSASNSFLAAPDISPSLFWAPDDDIMDTEQFTIRTYCANGDNSLFCTDGYVFKPIIRDVGNENPIPADATYTPRIPTCKYITSFQSRLVAAGGSPSFQNAPNQVFYSQADNPFAWGIAGAAANSINVFSAQPINGVGAYSQTLLDSGFASFLVISKGDGLFTWNGDTSTGATQLYYSFGFAGPRAFAVTNAGPLFVAQDSIYLLAGDKIIPVVDELEHVLRDLTKEQLAKISAVFHNEKFKFAYSSAANNELDTEWWFEQSTFQGKPVKYISGPHTLKPFTSQASTVSFDDEREVRISALDTDVYQRDSGKVNDGASITRTIVLSRLGLQEDHALKLLEEVFLAVKIEADETFDVAIGVEDGGTLTYSGTMTGSVAVASRQLIQHFVSQRILGRVNKLTITNTSSNSVSLFDISLIFTPKGRRLFR